MIRTIMSVSLAFAGVSCMLALTSHPAQAETLYRCVAAGGEVAYQDRPCGPGQSQTRAAEFKPETVRVTPPDAESPARNTRAAPKGQPKGRRARRPGGTGSLHGIRIESDRCRKAKLQRDAWERRVGLRRTFEDLRHWQDRINEVCR